MDRRLFIKGAAATGFVAVGAGGIWLRSDAYDGPLTIDYVLERIDLMAAAEQLSSSGAWNLSEVFEHCAQSVEYSMTGYPEHKPEWFKQTLGKTAYSVFAAKRAMSHALDEPIPGAPALGSMANMSAALQRFRQSLIDFKQYQGELLPHFAFGALTKQQYEQAHVMHFNNHLLEISA